MRLALFALILLAPLHAADDLQPLFDAFAKERTQATGSTEAADQLAARAEKARKAENSLAAARLIRDARWALPMTPPGLPKGSLAFGTGGIRHGDRVNSVRYSHDGKWLITASNDRFVKIWDVATGREVTSFRGAWDGVVIESIRTADAVLLPGGERIASVSMSGQQILVWDIKTGKTLLTLKPEWPPLEGGADKAKPTPMIIKSLAITADGNLVSGSDDKILRVWNLTDGKLIFKSVPVGRIECVAAQHKGKLVGCVDLDGYMSLFDPTAEKPEPVVRSQMTDGGSQSAYGIAFSADDSKILIGGADMVPKVIPAPGTQPATSLKLTPHTSEVRTVAVFPDGKHYVTGSKDKTVQITNELGELVRKVTLPAPVIAVDTRPDGKQIAIGCEDGSVTLFDFQAADDHTTSKDAKEPLWATAVNPAGSLIASAGADKAIRLYTPFGKLLKTLDGSTAAVTSLVFLGDTKLLSGGGDKLLRLWDADSGKPLGEWKGHSSAVLALAATPDGKLAVSGSADRAVNGWDAATGKMLWTWTGRSVISALAVSNDGKLVYVGSAEGGLSVLAVADGKATLLAAVNAHLSGVAAITLQAMKNQLVTVGGDGVPKLWTLNADGKLSTVLRFTPSMPPTANMPVALSSAVYSPDGKRVAVAGADQLIRIYDPVTGLETRFLRGCTDWVTALAFHPDGDRLIAVCADKAIRVFDVTRFEAVPGAGHASQVRALAVSADGKLLASVGDDKVIRLWDRATGKSVGTLPAPMEKFFAVSFAGPNLLAGGQGGKVSYWNAADRKEIATAAIGELFGITVAKDGQQAGLFYRNGESTNYGLYKLNDLTKPEAVISERPRVVYSASFSSDLKQVAAGDDYGWIFHWRFDAAARWPKIWLFEPNRVVDLGFSTDGTVIAALQKSGTVYLAETTTRKPVAKIDLRGADGHPFAVNALVVSPAGGRFAVVGEGPEIVVCDFTGKIRKRIPLPTAANLAAFAPDGNTLFTANTDGSLYALNLD